MATILTADNSTTMRKMLSYILSGDGHGILEAADGEEALSKAKSDQVDLVITGIDLPILDGLTLIKELRKLSNYKYTPMLLLTTEAEAVRKEEGKAAGASGWITKPFNPEQLLKTINKLLD